MKKMFAIILLCTATTHCFSQSALKTLYGRWKATVEDQDITLVLDTNRQYFAFVKPKEAPMKTKHGNWKFDSANASLQLIGLMIYPIDSLHELNLEKQEEFTSYDLFRLSQNEFIMGSKLLAGAPVVKFVRDTASLVKTQTKKTISIPEPSFTSKWVLVNSLDSFRIKKVNHKGTWAVSTIKTIPHVTNCHLVTRYLSEPFSISDTAVVLPLESSVESMYCDRKELPYKQSPTVPEAKYQQVKLDHIYSIQFQSKGQRTRTTIATTTLILGIATIMASPLLANDQGNDQAIKWALAGTAVTGISLVFALPGNNKTYKLDPSKKKRSKDIWHLESRKL